MNKQDREKLVTYRISKARETLNEVNIHVEHQLWNTAINRLYYACYYAVIALLIQNQIKAQTHSGVRQMFGLHFIKTGKIDKNYGKLFSDLYDLRQTGDYDDFIDFTKEDVLDILPEAETLIHQIERLIEKEEI